jgi:adenylate cyclase
MSGNDIVILDSSASRYHAQVLYDPERGQITVQDLGSTNGTYVNRKRLIVSRPLFRSDVIRIGQHTIELNNLEQAEVSLVDNKVTSQTLTRDLVLESLDQHAVLLSNVTAMLNTMLDLPTTLKTVSNMMKVAVGADRCETILLEHLDQLNEVDFSRSIVQQALQQHSAVTAQEETPQAKPNQNPSLISTTSILCVPLIQDQEILGLIYVSKHRPRARGFDQRDVQLAVAICDQLVMTLQRLRLLERARRQEMTANLLNRLLPAENVQFLLNEFLETGSLPPIQENSLTLAAINLVQTSEMIQRMGPGRYSDLVNTYYHEAREAVFSHGGMLNKGLGEGLLAVFGMPWQPVDPEERAVQCSLDLLERVGKLSESCGENLHISIGINSGEVMAGFLGSPEFVEFTIVGAPANLAWELQGQARPNGILVGEATYTAIRDQFNFQEHESIDVRNQEDKIKVYELVTG